VRQKNAEQTKEEEATSKKVHEEQEIAQRTQTESGIHYAKVSDQSSLYSQVIQDERNKSEKRSAYGEPSSMLVLIFLILGVLILLDGIPGLFSSE
jgi:uncharacterized membrane protein